MRPHVYFLVLLACTSEPTIPEAPCPRVHVAIPPSRKITPRWAFSPWISKDISNRDDTYAFVDGFKERDIPVGAVVLDSPWETNYNTFVPNPARYGDFASLVKDMHARGVAVVLWTTQMINTESYDLEPGGDLYEGPAPKYTEGASCEYFIDHAAEYNWWKGKGSAVDFFNADALAWLREQEDGVLKLGIDGWKLDFGENYITSAELQTRGGPMPLQVYSEAYYRDFLVYGRMKRGDGFVTMVRAWDESYQFKGRFYAKREDAPIAWMGDNRRDWFGLGDALHSMFKSAQAGYAVVGADLGGYLDRDDKALLTEIPFNIETFQKWIAVGALSPFMQLHGRANLTPWTVPVEPTETVDVYRYWAKLHEELVPFFYSLAIDAWAMSDKASIVVPIGAEASWEGDYRYTLGPAILVAPLVATGGKRDVVLPPGRRWLDFWDQTTPMQGGGTTVTFSDGGDRKRIPVYLADGAIVPMNVTSDTTGFFGDPQGALTILVVPGNGSFTLHEDDGDTTIVVQDFGSEHVRIDVSSAKRNLLFRLHRDTAPTSVTLNGPPSGTNNFDAAAHVLWIRTTPSGSLFNIEVQ